MKTVSSILVVIAVVGASVLVAAQDKEWQPDPTPAVKAVLDPALQLSISEHADLVWRLRRALDERLLTPASEHVTSFGRDVGGTDSGINRLLQRGLYDKVTLVRGGGCYFSFTTRSNCYNERPDVELQNGRLSSGFAGGDFGYVVPLEARNLKDVTRESVPENLTVSSEKLYKAWLANRGAVRDPVAEVGKVYVVRSIQFRDCDTLAVIHVIAADKAGITFTWKILKRFPVPERTR